MANVAATLRAEAAAVARCHAQLLFAHDARFGAVLWALTWLRPPQALMGLAAVLAAHATSAVLGLRPDLRRMGAHGYNALLFGLFAGLGHGWSPGLLLALLLGGAATALLTEALQERPPVLVVPFVLVTWLAAPALPAVPPDPLWLPLPEPALPTALDDALRGFAAILCLPGPLPGLVVLLTLVAATRHGALGALVGTVAALSAGALLGVPAGSTPSIALVYNGVFTGLALGAALLVPGRAALATTTLAGAAVALVATALGEVLPRLALPVLSLPFVLVTRLVLRVLGARPRVAPPYLTPLPDRSPEVNLEYVVGFARRFGPPGLPEFALPLGTPASGTWVVSQGHDGEHTHRGPWTHAWDFEVVDARNFPFTGTGERRGDHLAFGAPVLAPGAGTVVAIHDGEPDHDPGAHHGERPWGNAIVLQHGPALFSVLAHLQRGSLRCKPGQVVARGEPLAACGSSGRSPRPHVHFQAQATAVLGAPALPARLVHFLAAGSPPRFLPFGVPTEGERLAEAPPAPPTSPEAAFVRSLAPGAELLYTYVYKSTSAYTAPLRLRSEIGLYGERRLVDRDRGDVLHFLVNARELVFLHHDGPADAPLRALLLALPRLPLVDVAEYALEDRIPPTAVLSRAARWLRTALLPFGEPFRAVASLHARRIGDSREIATTTGLSGRTTTTAGRAVLDAGGLQLLELRSGATTFRLHRPDSVLPEVSP